MTRIDPTVVVRAWRDPRFAASLPAEVRRALPASPAGVSGSVDTALLAAGRVGPQGSVAATCNTVHADCNTVSSKCNTVHADCNTVSSNCNTVSSDCNTVSAKCNSVAADCPNGARA